MQSLLAYVVVMLTTFVLHHCADPQPTIRLLASSIFTKLLILLSLEVRLFTHFLVQITSAIISPASDCVCLYAWPFLLIIRRRFLHTGRNECVCLCVYLSPNGD